MNIIELHLFRSKKKKIVLTIKIGYIVIISYYYIKHIFYEIQYLINDNSYCVIMKIIEIINCRT